MFIQVFLWMNTSNCYCYQKSAKKHYIVIIKKESAWECWGGDSLPAAQLHKNVMLSVPEKHRHCRYANISQKL
jgi:hypothetical protein